MEVEKMLEGLTTSSYFWVIKIFVIVLATTVAAFVARRLLVRIQAHANRTHNPWDDALLAAAFAPTHALIWLLGLCWAASLGSDLATDSVEVVVGAVRKVGIIILGTWFLVGAIREAEKNLVSHDYKREPMDATTVSAIGKLLRLSVIITAVLVVMQLFGYSVSGILAFGGIGGLAVGFAAKDLLANFFGGLMIYLDRPFKVGDWVRSPDKDIEGTVEHIGWRLSCIRTFDKRPLYIPNSTFTHISVENPSRMLNRRIYETIGVRYEDAGKVREIIESVRDMLLTHPEIDTRQTLIVNFNKFASSSLDFFVYTFTKTTEWVKFHEIKQDVLLKILDIIESHGAECAFPTSTVHLPDTIQVAGHDEPEEK